MAGKMAPVETPVTTAVETPAEPERPRFNWEQFMGVKLFAWIGGLALFIGLAFFVAYSFQQNLIKPPMRVALGFLTGLGVMIGGLRLPREKYAISVQTLCAAGVLILYADIFASCSHYHFIPNAAGFGLMALVTAVAFLLADRLASPTVAILGLIGGFLTPPLLSTGEDNPLGLFGFVAMLDVGLAAVALRRRWNYLVLMAAIATIIIQFGWVDKFFEAYKFGTAISVFLGFSYLFVFLIWLAQKRDPKIGTMAAAGILLPTSALAFACYLLAYPYVDIVKRPAEFLTYIVLADLALLWLAWMRAQLRAVNVFAGVAVFLLLTIWTVAQLTPALLNWALVFYLAFAILHTVFPVVLERLRPAGTPQWWAHLFAPLALLLLMVPIFKLDNLSLAIWPIILLVDILAIGVAVVTMSLAGIIIVLAMTLFATALWILKLPAILTGLPELLFVIGGFALFFFFIGWYAARRIRLKQAEPAGGTGFAAPTASVLPGNTLAQIPALSAILPFLLLAMVVLRLPVTDPSPVFGLAALLVVLLLGVVRIYKTDWLGPIGLASLLMVEYAWHLKHFKAPDGMTPLLWYLGFYAVFALFPFVFQRHLMERVIPWAVAALAGPAQFYLVHRVVAQAYPNSYMGLLPTAFAVPSFLALIHLLRAVPETNRQRNSMLALFGGVALFFVTLIFPLQFERQWITIGWALEGAALLWLLHRVPHQGLKYLGVGLLGVAFVRLALNPAVLHYHQRSDTPILNWFLYAYGIVAVCLFAGARLLAPPHNYLKDLNVPPILRAFGTVLAFLLLNIEIADYYSTGKTITFEFSGNFARDMTYSLAWAAFAFVLLAWGIRNQTRAARYAGIGLLMITVLKLFLHDLWRLGALYRVGSFIGLALVLIPVSLLYQRYMSTHSDKKGADKTDQPKS
jgi:uncharacterized membrane protein